MSIVVNYRHTDAGHFFKGIRRISGVLFLTGNLESAFTSGPGKGRVGVKKNRLGFDFDILMFVSIDVQAWPLKAVALKYSLCCVEGIYARFWYEERTQPIKSCLPNAELVSIRKEFLAVAAT